MNSGHPSQQEDAGASSLEALRTWADVELMYYLNPDRAAHGVHPDPADDSSSSSPSDFACRICGGDHPQTNDVEFMFCCDGPIDAPRYRKLLRMGGKCPFCGEKVEPPRAQPEYIYRFGDRLEAEVPVEDKIRQPTTASEIAPSRTSQDESPSTSKDDPADMPECTRVQAFLIDSFQRFLDHMRVFDEDALTGEQKLDMVRKLGVQLGFSE